MPSQRLFTPAGGLVLALMCLVPIAAPAEDLVVPQFTDVAAQAGLRFKHFYGSKNLENVLQTTMSGCALFDYDNDGWLDVFFVNGTYLDDKGKVRTDKATHHGLFRNQGDGTFENVTRAAGLVKPSCGQGATVGDYDGDRFLDLYITNYGPNQLYRNRGDGTFEDVSVQAGVADDRYAGGAVFFDFDGDGDLDLYTSNYLEYSPEMKGVRSSAWSKRMGFKFFPGPRDYVSLPDLLYRNNGDGTFTDISEEVGLVPGGKGLTVAACDFDNDGDQDIFVANDAPPNHLYRNDGGQVYEMALEAGVAYDPDGAETAGMGVDIADVNRDGLADLYVTNMIFEFNNLYVNQGEMFFEDQTKSTGLHEDNYRHVGWANRFADFNNDGHLDLFIANGHLVDFLEGFSASITYAQQNFLFLGKGDGTFVNMNDDAGEPFTRKRVNRGGAFGDYDNDGDIDIILSGSNGRCELLRNNIPPNDRWLKIRLRGHPPNTYGIGAKVMVQLGDQTTVSEVRFGTAYLSSSDPTLHLGIPAGVTQAEIDVAWPSGRRSQKQASPGTVVVIEEPVESQPED
jgi:hypothetical protein